MARPLPPTTEHVFKLDFGAFSLLLVYFTDAAHVNFIPEPVAATSSRGAGGSDLYQLNQLDDGDAAHRSIVDSTNHCASAAAERPLSALCESLQQWRRRHERSVHFGLLNVLLHHRAQAKWVVVPQSGGKADTEKWLRERSFLAAPPSSSLSSTASTVAVTTMATASSSSASGPRSAALPQASEPRASSTASASSVSAPASALASAPSSTSASTSHAPPAAAASTAVAASATAANAIAPSPEVAAQIAALEKEIPDGWVVSFSKKYQRVFFYHAATKTQSWDKPTGPPPASQSK